MLTKTPKTTYLKDYAPPAYRLPTIDLRFELGEDFTTVRSHLRVERIDATSAGTPLVLCPESSAKVSSGDLRKEVSRPHDRLTRDSLAG